ncbi:MAG: dihydropyrimidinase [Candidatus Eisenbacteria bacterium]|nr:dihydropyrimidinase [Candidatus Eisenbacteria bacterium]
MRFDTILRGGRAILPGGARDSEIGIVGERIAAIEPRLPVDGTTKVIDAHGMLVLPGVIDAHVHLELPVNGALSADDFRTGTRAGARGGVTTVIDFATPESGQSLDEAVKDRLRAAEGKALVDFSLHVCITDWDRQKGEISDLIRRGFPTFKEFMIYEERGLRSDHRAMEETLLTLRDRGGMLLVHAESPEVIARETERLRSPERMRAEGARMHVLTRPPEAEIEAVRRAADLCVRTRAPLYVVHLSTGGGAAAIEEARRKGAPLFAETCPQYLVLDESVFDRPDGHRYATCPRVGSLADGDRLWSAIREGVVSVISTDTCTFTRAQKDAWGGDWMKIPMGLPGLETLLPLVYTHGVRTGRIGLERMVEVLSAAPARLMGLAPRKGSIAVGADADLVVIDPEKTRAVRPEEMEGGADWSPYEGRELAGFARTTLSRGEVIVDDYRVVGRDGRGLFLSRGKAGRNGG